MLQIYVLDRKELTIKSTSRCLTWEIDRDYLTNAQSKFTNIDQCEFSQGDFILVRDSKDMVYTSFNKSQDDIQDNYVKPFYFGVIDSYEDGSFVCCDIYNLVNFEFVKTNMTGVNLGDHLMGLTYIYLLYDVSKNMPQDGFDWSGQFVIDVDPSAVVSYAFTYEENPSVSNLLDFFIEAFDKYGVVWEIDHIEFYPESNYNKPAFLIYTIIKQKQNHLQIKDNSNYFTNWDVYVSPQNYGFENKLLIVDADMSEAYRINGSTLATYYITMDGTITQVLSDAVYQPTKTKIYLYDIYDSSAPYYDEVAQSELTRTDYSHEITVDMKKDNPLINMNDLDIGTQASIMYQGNVYNSMLTGYSMKSGSDIVSLKFGMIRSTIKKYL